MDDTNSRRMARAAQVMASSARAIARVEGMKAENMVRKTMGDSMAFHEDDFVRVIDEEGIGHNPVQKLLWEDY